MSDQILEFLQEKISRFQKLDKAKQKHIILLTTILILGAGMFLFSVLSSYASSPKSLPVKNVSQRALDPLNKVGENEAKPQVKAMLCGENDEGADRAREEQLIRLVSGTPIEAMVPYIAKRDPRVAAYLVAIARKESSWGEHAPSKDGETCYNYWGYKSSGTRGTAMGYACFVSDEEGVRKVGDRIQNLLDKKIDTPSEMVVWKCGRTCAGHDPAGVKKWISDVALYYGKMIALKAPAPANDRLVSFKK